MRIFQRVEEFEHVRRSSFYIYDRELKLENEISGGNDKKAAWNVVRSSAHHTLFVANETATKLDEWSLSLHYLPHMHLIPARLGDLKSHSIESKKKCAKNHFHLSAVALMYIAQPPPNSLNASTLFSDTLKRCCILSAETWQKKERALIPCRADFLLQSQPDLTLSLARAEVVVSCRHAKFPHYCHLAWNKKTSQQQQSSLNSCFEYFLQRLLVIFAICLAMISSWTSAEQQIKLEDIERDTLIGESKKAASDEKEDSTQTAENSQHIQLTYSGNPQDVYVTPQPGKYNNHKGEIYYDCRLMMANQANRLALAISSLSLLSRLHSSITRITILVRINNWRSALARALARVCNLSRSRFDNRSRPKHLPFAKGPRRRSNLYGAS